MLDTCGKGCRCERGAFHECTALYRYERVGQADRAQTFAACKGALTNFSYALGYCDRLDKGAIFKGTMTYFCYPIWDSHIFLLAVIFKEHIAGGDEIRVHIHRFTAVGDGQCFKAWAARQYACQIVVRNSRQRHCQAFKLLAAVKDLFAHQHNAVRQGKRGKTCAVSKSAVEYFGKPLGQTDRAKIPAAIECEIVYPAHALWQSYAFNRIAVSERIKAAKNRLFHLNVVRQMFILLLAGAPFQYLHG